MNQIIKSFILTVFFIQVGVVGHNNVKYVNITVAQDGSGTVKTISEAIEMAPEKSLAPYIIHIKAGEYAEKNLTVKASKTNLWFVGEGKGRTLITGNKSVGHDKVRTVETATFVAWGTGLVLQNISFVNDAGPIGHQAVALLVGADQATIYHCEIKGYQDTLWVNKGRQFYRECDIYGTIDYIFGDAACVFQNCTLWARKPMEGQQNAITAQGRESPNVPKTGISVHACQLRAVQELKRVQSKVHTYLGRPWRKYAVVVFLESFIGDHIEARGWLEWNSTSPVNDLYYGEYLNIGPGADISHRARWPGVHPNMTRVEAENFTVAQFIQGQTWINGTGVPYLEGLLS